jgi:transposase
MGNKKSYDPELKRQVVARCLESGNSVVGVATEMRIPFQTVGNWVRKWRKQGDASFTLNGGANTGTAVILKPLSVLELENRRLIKENEVLRMEREILKKATAFFAKESK